MPPQTMSTETPARPPELGTGAGEGAAAGEDVGAAHALLSPGVCGGDPCPLWAAKLLQPGFRTTSVAHGPCGLGQGLQLPLSLNLPACTVELAIVLISRRGAMGPAASGAWRNPEMGWKAAPRGPLSQNE